MRTLLFFSSRALHKQCLLFLESNIVYSIFPLQYEKQSNFLRVVCSHEQVGKDQLYTGTSWRECVPYLTSQSKLWTEASSLTSNEATYCIETVSTATSSHTTQRTKWKSLHKPANSASQTFSSPDPDATLGTCRATDVILVKPISTTLFTEMTVFVWLQ
jgi:hypothetical protein